MTHINNMDHWNLFVDFSGLATTVAGGSQIRPTDIDAYLDYGARASIFYEFKHERGSMTRGQELALERLCQQSTVPALAIYAQHAVDVEDEDPRVQAHDLKVSAYYSRGSWRLAPFGVTVRHLQDKFISWIEK